MTVANANPLICALDTSDLDQLRAWSAALAGEVGLFKVGLEAFVAHGHEAVSAAAAHAPVFLDLKLHDIPNTVAAAASAAAASGAAMLTVHAAGGRAMIEAAAGAAAGLDVLAVTVLTSLDDHALAEVGQDASSKQVPRLAALAVEAGASGIVCAPPEVAAVRAAAGPEASVVVPGIRPAGAELGDQIRVGTPRAAIDAGADFLVVGRPITRADDPVAAARAIRQELA